MTSLADTLHARLEIFLADHHLTLVHPTSPFDRDDPAAISADVPDLRIHFGESSFPSRRQRLRFRDGEFDSTLLARLRPAPRPTVAENGFTAYALNGNARSVPVATLDPVSCTLQVLVDFRSARSIRGEPVDIETLFTTVFETPIRHLLRSEQMPRIGAEFADRLRAFLAHRPRLPRRDPVREEIAYLESTPPELNDLRPRAQARLEELRTLVAERKRRSRRFGSGTLDGEIDRLVRLVRMRAVSVLRIVDGGMDGLLNPTFRPEDEELIPAHVFSLRLDPVGNESELGFANPNMPRFRDHECLGYGAFYFPVLHRLLGAYGLVDGILNFRESNFGEPFSGLQSRPLELGIDRFLPAV